MIKYEHCIYPYITSTVTVTIYACKKKLQICNREIHKVYKLVLPTRRMRTYQAQVNTYRSLLCFSSKWKERRVANRVRLQSPGTSPRTSPTRRKIYPCRQHQTWVCLSQTRILIWTWTTRVIMTRTRLDQLHAVWHVTMHTHKNHQLRPIMTEDTLLPGIQSGAQGGLEPFDCRWTTQNHHQTHTPTKNIRLQT